MFLTGAPVAMQLNWSEVNLVSNFLAAGRRILELESEEPPSILPSSQSTGISNWRRVPLDTKTFYESPAISRKTVQSTEYLPFDHRDFLEHSYAVLDELQSSQIAPHGSIGDEEETTFVTSTSFSTTISDDTNLSGNISHFSSSAPHTSARQAIQISGPLTDIRSIPNAHVLETLRPQTMTVNLVAGIISISPAKTVNVRRGNYAMDVVEILVGDDTKAGFGISTWLAPVNPQSMLMDEIRHSLQALRPGDVVLVERLALSTFRDQVFGQSLNRKSTKNTTRFMALATHSATLQDGIPSSITNKIQRVHDWVSSYVGPGRKRRTELDQATVGKRTARGGRTVTTAAECLPPDTP